MATLDAKPDYNATEPVINAGFDACRTLPGYGWDTAVKASKKCKAGTWSAGWSLDSCYPCQEGYTTEVEGAEASAICKVAPGYYLNWVESMTGALRCNEGEYCLGFNSTEPTSCPNGTFSDEGAKSAADCDDENRGHP